MGYAYVLIGVVIAILALRSIYKDKGFVDALDVFISTFFFGIFWPFGAFVSMCFALPTLINKGK